MATAQLKRAIFFAPAITVIILLVDSNVMAGVKAYPFENVITFHATGQPGGLIDAEKAIDINVKLAPKDWAVISGAYTQKQRRRNFPDRISVYSPYTIEYEKMDSPEGGCERR